MAVKYLVAGPVSAFVSIIVLITMGVGVFPAIGLSWLVGCAAIAGLVVFQMFHSDEVTQTASTAEAVRS
jgi:type IV secretory pathway VirB2 component (pilin)